MYDDRILTICNHRQCIQYVHINNFNKGFVWCFPEKKETILMVQSINLGLPAVFSQTSKQYKPQLIQLLMQLNL